MSNYLAATNQPEAFIRFALSQKVVKFGEFTLKSGRASPYFFNIGAIQSGKSLQLLGEFYACRLKQIMEKENLSFDMILGPAYKGIPIASATAIAMQQNFSLDIPYCFNRKEEKQHGEGGEFIGCPPSGKILLVDDVITAGTAVNEILNLLARVPNTKVVGLLIAFDRQEKTLSGVSATAELAKKHDIPVFYISAFSDLLSLVQKDPSMTDTLRNLTTYRNTYGTE